MLFPTVPCHGTKPPRQEQVNRAVKAFLRIATAWGAQLLYTALPAKTFLPIWKKSEWKIFALKIKE